MDPSAFLERLDGERAGSLEHVQRIPERAAESVEIPMDPDLSVRLRRAGIERLWIHQAEALEHLRAGRNTVVATGTASGKSLCYQLATFERLIADPKATALYLFPTKALSQDQLRQVRSFAVTAARAAVYDGDTQTTERAWVRRNANLVITNPDMLHFGILPQSDRWAAFLANLSIVVVDELHTLRGVFGSHVACVVRRLRRLAAARGARPVFACSSATIGNPAELARSITGMEHALVDRDGSPRGTKYFALWNPPLDTDARPPERRSPTAEAADLTARLLREDAHTITFARSRKQAELIAEFT
ncbi:MAG: DEAD/DEAH box helicase, partial [Actinomycetota bacterium]